MASYPQLTARRILQHGFQFCILVFGKILLHPFTRVDSSAVKPKFLQNQPYILVANHRHAIDPFVIGCCLPVGTVFKITPVSFMTANVFYDSPLRPFLWLSGGYPARNTHGKHALFGVDGSVQLLQQGFSIFIFPEGTRVRNAARGQAHTGVIRIHNAVPKTPMILAHIEYNRGLKAWLTRRVRVVTYRLVNAPNYNDPEQIMDDVYAL